MVGSGHANWRAALLLMQNKIETAVAAIVLIVTLAMYYRWA